MNDTLTAALTEYLSAVLGGGAPTRSPAVLQRAGERLMQRAATEARAEAIRELQTTEQAAATLGITPQRVRAIARSRNVGWNVGRDWLFRPEDVDAMRSRPPGRPATR